MIMWEGPSSPKERADELSRRRLAEEPTPSLRDPWIWFAGFCGVVFLLAVIAAIYAIAGGPPA